MTQKIEVLTAGLGGPCKIIIDGKVLHDVESYELEHDESGVHRLTLTVFTNNFHIEKDESLEKAPKLAKGGIVNRAKMAIVGDSPDCIRPIRPIPCEGNMIWK